MLEGPAFPELPSILDLNCFLMFVNLHFSISTLFISLSSPYGHCAPLEDDPTILPLMGITDAHLVKLAAAAHILQFLLTCSPVMDDQPCMYSMESLSHSSKCVFLMYVADGSSGHNPDDTGLQQLWIKYRKVAKCVYINFVFSFFLLFILCVFF